MRRRPTATSIRGMNLVVAIAIVALFALLSLLCAPEDRVAPGPLEA